VRLAEEAAEVERVRVAEEVRLSFYLPYSLFILTLFHYYPILSHTLFSVYTGSGEGATGC